MGNPVIVFRYATQGQLGFTYLS